MISSKTMEDLQNATKRRLGKRFGTIAVKNGFVLQKQVDRAMAIQAEEYRKTHSCRRIGDILVDMDVLTEDQRNVIRREQENIEKLVPHEGESFQQKKDKDDESTDHNISDSEIEKPVQSSDHPEDGKESSVEHEEHHDVYTFPKRLLI